MDFSIKSLPLKETLGERLKRIRKDKRFEIKYVEERTKIRAKYLEALEVGDYSKLPPDVYIKGFLKNYADFLNLDKEMVLSMYAKERGLKETVKRAAEKGSKKKSLIAHRFVITPKILFLSAVSFAVLAIILYIGWQVKILAAPPKLEITNPSDNATLETDAIYVEGKTDEGADIYINNVQVGGGPEGEFKERVSLQNGVNTITVIAKNKMGKEVKLTRNVVVKLAPVQVAAEEIKGVELKVNAGPNSAWIYVEVDGAPAEKEGIVMLSGSSRTFKGKDKIVLTTKNAGSTNITFNGKDIGILGKEGETVKNREFTKDMQVK